MVMAPVAGQEDGLDPLELTQSQLIGRCPERVSTVRSSTWRKPGIE